MSVNKIIVWQQHIIMTEGYKIFFELNVSLDHDH